MSATLILPTTIIDDLTTTSDAVNAWLDRFTRIGMIQIRMPIAQLRTTLTLNGQKADQITAEQVATLEIAYSGDVDVLVNNTNGERGRNLGIPDWFDIPAAALLRVLDAGGDIVNLAYWLRVPDAAYGNPVVTTVGLRDTGLLDENGDPIRTKFWSEWSDAEHLRLDEGGTTRNYIPIRTSGTWELGSVIKALSDEPGAVVRSAKQIQVIQAAQV